MHLVAYILEILNTSTRVPVPDICPKEEVVRRLQTFPSRPVIRKLGEFRKDRGNLKIREQRKMTGISRKDSPNEQKEIEKIEFKEDNISCTNDHNTGSKMTPGLFVISCIHKVIWGN